MERKDGTTMKTMSEACWAQARANYAASVTLLDAGVYFASVFFAQQAAEMALRATTIERENRIPRGHNLIQMCNGLNAPLEVMNAAVELNPEFLATRSPEAVSDVPAQNYDRKSARLHLKSAQAIVDWIKASLY